MDTVSLHFFAEAAKDMNFTKTAQRLFISQQTLSNHIARLEEQYQVRLFDRKPRLTLTYAGETMLSFAREFQNNEDNLKAQLTDITQQESVRLRIGCTPHRTTIVMPALTERFLAKYPHVKIELYVYHSVELMEMLANGDLDFAIAIEKTQHPLLLNTPLFHDSIYLMLSRQLMLRYYGDSAEERIQKARANGADLKDFIEIPFVDVRSANLIRDVFWSADLSPHFAVTVNFPQFALPNFFENVAASIITTTTYANIRKTTSEDLLFFRVNTASKLPLHDVAFMRLKKKHMSRYDNYFLQLAKEYFSSIQNSDPL